MPKTRMTLKELSKILNLSISTISKALNDSSEISEATIKRVKEAADMYQYQPNKMALRLKFGKTNTIGVIVPSIKNNFFTDVLSGIEHVLEKEKYSVIISITNESYIKEEDSLATLTSGLTDGVIMAVAEETQIAETFEHIETSSKPIVLFDRVITTAKQNTLVGDDFEAVKKATEYLISNNKKAIALVSTIHNLSVGKQREAGFNTALTFDRQNEKLGHHLKSTPATLDADIAKMLKTTPVDGIVTLDEESSLAVLKAAKKQGINVPEELSIIGYANETLAEHVSPQLSTINQHGFEMGRQAAETMIATLKEKENNPLQKTIASTIVHRETS